MDEIAVVVVVQLACTDACRGLGVGRKIVVVGVACGRDDVAAVGVSIALGPGVAVVSTGESRPRIPISDPVSDVSDLTGRSTDDPMSPLTPDGAERIAERPIVISRLDYSG